MTRAPLPEPRAGGRPYRVCFVCTGNICRSPMADVVLRWMADRSGLAGRLAVSSAGTGPWHEGEPMDPRARRALAAAGYADHGHVAHQVDPSTLVELDLLVALDRRHRQTLASLVPQTSLEDRLVLLRSFDPRAGGALDVPDPFYGEADDFARCLRMVEGGCRGLADALGDVLVPASLAAPGGEDPR